MRCFLTATTLIYAIQGSLPYTPEPCLVNGGVPLFWWKKPCFKWAKISFLWSPAIGAGITAAAGTRLALQLTTTPGTLVGLIEKKTQIQTTILEGP